MHPCKKVVGGNGDSVVNRSGADSQSFRAVAECGGWRRGPGCRQWHGAAGEKGRLIRVENVWDEEGWVRSWVVVLEMLVNLLDC